MVVRGAAWLASGEPGTLRKWREALPAGARRCPPARGALMPVLPAAVLPLVLGSVRGWRAEGGGE